MVTLHRYVLRELLKTFALAVAALTGLFTMGGGLYNLVRSPGLTAASLLDILPLLLPVVVTLTLPLAALFAATMVYGRLAADNEFLACRAAGINVHRMFLSAVLLAVFVTAFTLLFGNFVIPDFMKRLDHFARANLRDIAFQQLRSRGHVRYQRRYFLTAERVQDVEAAALTAKGLPVGDGLSYLLVSAPSYLQLDDDGRVTRFATARWGLCQFDTRGTAVRVTVYVSGAQNIEIGQHATRVGRQRIGPIDLSGLLRFPVKASMVDLDTLLRWYAAPWEAAKLRPRVQQFLRRLGRHFFYRECVRRLGRAGRITLQDERGWSYRVAAERCRYAGQRPLLIQAEVAVSRPGLPRPTRYRAPRALLVANFLPDEHLEVEIRLQRTAAEPVRQYDARADDQSAARRKPALALRGLRAPPELLRAGSRYTAASVFEPGVRLPSEGKLGQQRRQLWSAAAKVRRQVAALVHFRLGCAASALVTILMGAALGLIFRGARMLAAFGLACIPCGTVTVLMVMGRQLAEHAGTEALGGAIIWGGLLATGLADGLLIWFGVRR